MPSYPVNVRRCQHLKVNGTQCGSPALRDEDHCYYHLRWQPEGVDATVRSKLNGTFTPTLEDANSIQVTLADVVGMILMRQIDYRSAGLILYALQTASSNVKSTSLEPAMPTRVVIDPESVERRPIGATAWSMVEGREYDEIPKNEGTDKNDRTDRIARKPVTREDEPQAAAQEAPRHAQTNNDPINNDPTNNDPIKNTNDELKKEFGERPRGKRPKTWSQSERERVPVARTTALRQTVGAPPLLDSSAMTPKTGFEDGSLRPD